MGIFIKSSIILMLSFLFLNLALGMSNPPYYATLSSSIFATNGSIYTGQYESVKFNITGGAPTFPMNYSIVMTNDSNGNIVASNSGAMINSKTWYFNFSIPSNPNALGKLDITGTGTDAAGRFGSSVVVIHVIAGQAKSSTSVSTVSTVSTLSTAGSTSITSGTSSRVTTALNGTVINNTYTTIQQRNQSNPLSALWQAILSFLSKLFANSAFG